VAGCGERVPPAASRDGQEQPTTGTFGLTLNYPGPTYGPIYADLAQATADWSRDFNSDATFRTISAVRDKQALHRI
jgi:hypothetical protein